jgi:hypothetical protein
MTLWHLRSDGRPAIEENMSGRTRKPEISALQWNAL